MIMMMNAVVLTVPAIANATADEYHPINFTQPIRLDRGAISPIGLNAVRLSDGETCAFVKKESGWDDSGCKSIDQAVFNMGLDIDTLFFSKPVSDGYVKLDDFFADGADESIKAITDGLREDAKAQSKALGKSVEFIGWRSYPKADRQRGLIYYAFDMRFDGAPSTNIKVMLLDRQGYIVANIVPVANDLDEAGVKKVVDQAVSTYKPDATTSYAAYNPGDKVAAYGGLGVLATVLGVKYGKAATVGIGILIVALLKKGAFLLALPFIFAGKLFRRISSKKVQE